MHYVCALRNLPALQLLLQAQVDPNIQDHRGMVVMDWVRLPMPVCVGLCCRTVPVSGAVKPIGDGLAEDCSVCWGRSVWWREGPSCVNQSLLE